MRIGIDLDSVLNDLEDGWSRWIMEHHDPLMHWSNWNQWEISELTPAGEAVYEFLKIPGAFQECLPRGHAVEVVKRLILQGHELFVVSSCTDTAREWPEKVAWLRKYFPEIPASNYIACSRKGLLRLDILVDDGLHNFEGFEGKGIVFDQPWNQQDVVLHRAYNWPQIERFVEIIGGGNG